MVPNTDDKLKAHAITMWNRMQEITTIHGTTKVVDECTNFKVSHFFQRKDQMAEAMCELIKL